MTTLLTAVLVIGLLLLALVVWLQRRSSQAEASPERNPQPALLVLVVSGQTRQGLEITD